MSKPKIAIIGAGPAGLMLARILHVNDIPCTIFERDRSPSERSILGGSLDLHKGSGQEAIRQGGLWDQTSALLRWDAQAYKISDPAGNLWVDVKDIDLGRPEISRPDLHRVLYESLPQGCVRWDHRLKSIDDDRTLHFENGQPSQGGFDLVVGADGVRSKVRPYVSYIPPFYAGLQGYEMWLRNSDKDFPELSSMVGNGAHFAVGEGEGRFLAMLKESNGDVQCYLWLRRPESWNEERGLETADAKTIKAYLLKEELTNWAPVFKNFIEACEDRVTPRKLYMLHVGTRWLSKPGLTLIGDAAHVMSVFAGEGVNVSLHDSLSLAKSIIANPGNIKEAISQYEQEMFPRAEASQQLSWESLQTRFEHGGNQKLADRFAKYVAQIKSGNHKEVGTEGGPHPDGIWGN